MYPSGKETVDALSATQTQSGKLIEWNTSPCETMNLLTLFQVEMNLQRPRKRKALREFFILLILVFSM